MKVTPSVNQAQIKCLNFNGKEGSCKYGNKCRFSHIEETPEEYKARKEKEDAIKERKRREHLRREQAKTQKYNEYVNRKEQREAFTARQRKHITCNNINMRPYPHHNTSRDRPRAALKSLGKSQQESYTRREITYANNNFSTTNSFGSVCLGGIFPGECN